MWILTNPVRDYAWGSTTLIPDLVGSPSTDEPLAEMWFGAHAGAPSVIRADQTDQDNAQTLRDFIANHPDQTLGSAAAKTCGGELPFLAKFIAAAAPLSIQTHPEAEQARAGFAAEDAAGVPVDARGRRYRDPFPKPELIMAMTEFDALVGLRAPEHVAADLKGCEARGVDAVRSAVSAAQQSGHWGESIAWVLDSARDEVDIDGLVKFLQDANTHQPGSPVRLLPYVAEHFPQDPGIIVALFMHALTLAPGEALYVPAGLLHTYMRGLGLEVMAPSDNVLRAGLTGKHIDVEELLRLVDDRPAPVNKAVGHRTDRGTIFTSAAGFFEVLIHEPSAQQAELPVPGPAMAIPLGGEVTIADGSSELHVSTGQAVFVGVDTPAIRVTGHGGLAIVGTPGSLLPT